MTLVTDFKVPTLTGEAPDINDKRLVLDFLERRTPAQHRRLDGVNAFAAAYDVFTTVPRPDNRPNIPTKLFFREFAVEHFIAVKNLAAMVWAYDTLREVYGR